MGLENYRFEELLAVQWNPELAAQFPNADHWQCRQEMMHDGEKWVPYSPVRCIGWHCPRCGEPTNLMGHHQANSGKCRL